LTVHPHLLFEIVAYSGGFQLYLLLRRRWPRREATVPLEQNLWVIVGAVFGALIGAKLLALVESPHHYWELRHHLPALLGGKTIVGGLLGGWAGVEVAKRRLGIARRTGDVYVFPLVFGMCAGRVGCLLTGLADHTHGVATALPWAVDFGDGVPRHPTQVYEIAFLLMLAIVLLLRMRRPWNNGDLFRFFLLGYLAFRLAVEFIKPTQRPFFGLSAIQAASLGGALLCLWQVAGRCAGRAIELPAVGQDSA
jgi:prolipoprotein diacylglyceryltransferase